MNTLHQEGIDLDLVKDEYFHLQKTVEDFDQRGLTIKGWSVTVTLAGVAAALTQKQPALLLLAAFTAILFWLIEAIWKRSQLAYYFRLETIEAFLNGDDPEGFTAQRITRDWKTGVKRYTFMYAMFQPRHISTSLCYCRRGSLFYGWQRSIIRGSCRGISKSNVARSVATILSTRGAGQPKGRHAQIRPFGLSRQNLIQPCDLGELAKSAKTSAPYSGHSRTAKVTCWPRVLYEHRTSSPRSNDVCIS